MAILPASYGDGFFAGVGQTVDNLLTSYFPRRFSLIESPSSRVTGVRFEAGFTQRLVPATAIACVVTVNPGVRGVQRTNLAPPFHEIRYLKYVSRYDIRNGYVDGVLADRNVGIMPLTGYRVRL